MAQADVRAVITAEDRASSTIQGVGLSFGKMAGAVAVGQLAVQAFVKAASMLADAGKFAINSAADFEQNRTAFETMLGSADKARVLLKQISEFAAKTPFELPQVVTAGQQLLAYGVNAEEVIPILKSLGNASRGNADIMGRVVMAFGQVRAAGHLTGMELRQFTEAGIGLLEPLAKKFGKTTGEIQEMVSAGEIGFPVVQEVLADMSKEGGKFFNLMEKQSLTFNGVISNISDNLGKVAREFVGISDTGDIRQGSIFFYLTQGAQSFLAFLDKNKDGIIGFFQNAFTTAITLLKQAFDFLRPALEQFWNVLSTQLGPALQQLWIAIQPLLPYIGAALIGAIYALVVALTVVATVLSAVVNTVADFVNFITNLPTSIQNTANSAVGWFQWLANNWTSILGYVIGFIASIPAKVLMILVDMNVRAFNYLKGINWGQVADWFVDYWKSIPGRIYNIMIEVTKMIRSINWGDLAMGIGKGFVNSINGFIEGAINGAMSGLPGSPKIKLPRFARGVQNFGGGLAIVGERGPEVVSLPRGSDVIPNNQLATSSTNNTTININVGLMTGSAVERRDAAAKMFEDLKDIASSRGMSVGQMIGAA